MRALALSMLASLASCGRFDFESHDHGGSADARAGRDALAIDALAIDASHSGPVALYRMNNDPSTGDIPALPDPLSAHCGSGCPIAETGIVDGGYKLGGSTRIELPSSTLVGLAPFTVAVWIEPASSAELYSVVSKPLDLTSTVNVFSLTVRGSTGEIAYESTDGAFPPTSPDLREAWHHVAATWDGTTRRLFVDGALLAEKAGAFADSALPVAFGADLDRGAPDIFYIGGLDELRFYDRALAADEVTALATP